MSDRTPVLLRFAPDLLARVDRARGGQKRTPFLINLIETQLQRQTSLPEGGALSHRGDRLGEGGAELAVVSAVGAGDTSKGTAVPEDFTGTRPTTSTSPPEDKRGADAPEGAADSSQGTESLGPVRHTEEVGTGASSDQSSAQGGARKVATTEQRSTGEVAQGGPLVGQSPDTSSPEQGLVPVGRDEDGADTNGDAGADRDSESAPDLDPISEFNWWEA